MRYKYFIRTIFLLLFVVNSLKAQDLVVEDPIKIRGFHLDLRIQVMKMPALKDFALKLSQNGINTLVMEWEGTYPFKNQPLIPNRFAYSREEIKSFISYCNSLNIDVIPLQQSFGHVEYILRHYRYKDLREDQKDYSQVNPLKESLNKELFTDLYKDLISTHTSEYIHIGGDETYLLGHSEESKQKVLKVGKGRLYGDYIKLLCDIVIGLGKKPVLWADIALKYPEVLTLLPKETIFIDWNYGWDINMFGDHKKLMESGFNIWGSPSIRSHPDNYFLSQWEKHFQNIQSFIPTARDLGYKGIVMTSWSTSGLYSPVFETTKDIVDLYAIRRVYPITGFNMLIEAYFESLKSSKPLATADFVSRYSQKKYGFNKTQSSVFWNALKAAPYEINQGKISNPSVNINQLLDSAKTSAKVLKELKPLSNKAEFEHYRLMADIRTQYLTYMLLEMKTNSPSFTQDMIPEVLHSLKALNTKKIDKKFIKLNKSALYKAELEQENELRNSKINLLYKRLSGNKNSN
ncbi:beta-N-acetylhexosaminidase [Pedobacter cryophilus]|uniref:Beta-N-acetylhexosaminidase n=1 Tax=Pedobacter cryophilus TaxID=2571271 RepID=A0A4U1C4U8_9SPHI|nr:beta-N-acetylhexosaminidase [Pedobacter cryophilus]TKB99199.1 beta-N-acetylhexosaminidase [Pedobacter cryophilus]